jgi:hypothetical protein
MTKITLKLIARLSLLLLFSFSANIGKATHMMGADVTYRKVGKMKYEFMVTVYRDCRGVPLSNITSAVRCASGSGSSISVSLTRVSIKDITNSCSSVSKPCSPANTRASKGVEQHIFLDTIDFSSSKYKALLKCSPNCEIIFEVGQCCRNGSINTGPANSNYYTFAMINPCIDQGNSSSQLTGKPFSFLCCNVPVYYNLGAKDTMDNDSLSYNWSCPLSARGTPVKYTPPYSCKKPIKVYDPSGTGYTNPNTNPPLGLYLDPKTGDLIFTPTGCSQVTVVVLEVKEWRKDTSGTYKHIGTVRRDMQFWIEKCPGNNPPTIKGPFAYSVCAGDSICFTVVSDDKPKTLPGKPSPPKDTVRLKWNNGIPDATFTLSHDSILQQSGRFCWSPPESSARTLPYTFSVTAKDNACPILAETTRAFSVIVKKKAKGKQTITPLSCNQFEISGDTVAGFVGTPTYQWLLLDSSGNTLFDSAIGVFNSTASFISVQKKDTISFFKGGKYILKYTIDNPPHRCPTIYYDTVSILVNQLPVLTLPADMVECCDAGFLNLNKNLTPKGGNWYSSKNPSYVDSGYRFNSSLACNPNSKTSHFVTYIYTDPSTGCTNKDSLSIALNPLPRVLLANGYFCQDKNSVKLDEILVLPAKLTGPSRTVNCLDCGSYNFSNILGVTGPSFDQQFTFDISPSGMNLGSKDVDSIIIEFIYGDANGCIVRDTATIIVTKVPQIKFLAIPDMCWDEGKVDLKQRTAVTPTDGFWFCYDTTLAMPGFRYCADPSMNGALTNNTFGGDTINTLATNSLGGTYYMRYMHTRSGCPTFRDTFMTINPLPKPVIDVSVLNDSLIGYTPPPYLFCEDRADISVVASPGGGVWSSPYSGAMTGNTFRPSGSPTNAPFYITYLYTDANGCVSRDSSLVKVTAKPTIRRSNDTLFSSVGLKYQWYDSAGLVTGADSQFYVFTKSSKYHVLVDFTCGQMSTDTISASLISVPKTNSDFFELYPNPANTYVQIKIAGNTGASICLLDLSGKCVLRQYSEKSNTKMELKNVASGVYWIMVEFNDTKGYQKLIVE